MRAGLLVSVLFACFLIGCSDNDQAGTSPQTSNGPRENSEPADSPAAGPEEPNAAAPLDSVSEFLKRAETHAARGEIAQAIEALNEAIRTDPKDASAYFARASILARLGEDRYALNDFNTTIKLAPQNAHYYNSRGSFFLTRRVYSRATEDFTKALELAPESFQAYNNRGLALVARGDHQAAIVDFDAAIQLNPKYAEAWHNRGFAHFSTGDHEKAAADFEHTLQINPDFVHAYANRGLLHLQQEQFEKAVLDFTQAIARDRDNPAYYQRRREAYSKLGKQDEARSDADKIAWLGQLGRLNAAVTREPQEPTGYIQRAEHLVAGGEAKIGLANYERAIRIDPGCGQVYSSRAAYWYQKGEYDKAIDDCTKGMEIDPHHEAYSVRGDAYFQKGDYDRAIADYTTSRRLDVTVARAYFRRSQVRKAQGDQPGAARDLERAVAMDPSLKDEAAQTTP